MQKQDQERYRRELEAEKQMKAQNPPSSSSSDSEDDQPAKKKSKKKKTGVKRVRCNNLYCFFCKILVILASNKISDLLTCFLTKKCDQV